MLNNGTNVFQYLVQEIKGFLDRIYIVIPAFMCKMKFTVVNFLCRHKFYELINCAVVHEQMYNNIKAHR